MAEIIQWVLGLLSVGLIGTITALLRNQVDIASMKARLKSAEDNHAKLHTLVTEQNYRFEGKLERLSDKVETKADK